MDDAASGDEAAMAARWVRRSGARRRATRRRWRLRGGKGHLAPGNAAASDEAAAGTPSPSSSSATQRSPTTHVHDRCMPVPFPPRYRLPRPIFGRRRAPSGRHGPTLLRSSPALPYRPAYSQGQRRVRKRRNRGGEREMVMMWHIDMWDPRWSHLATTSDKIRVKTT
uniref:Uncharacterized protein n=1 Tax=Oryza sativa subsp. japonica TaxID=39947 RepID=Q6Z0V0_ORYSJ|nr:hypothetical protein [Oryza sativa Japonica Group]